MRSFNSKSLMILTIFIASIMLMPIAVNAEEDNRIDFNQFGAGRDLINDFQGGFGNMLGGLGYGGTLLGRVFEMLFVQAYNDFEAREMMSGVYVLSAFNEDTYDLGVTNYGSNGEPQYHLLPETYDDTGIPKNGTVYCKVVKTGSYDSLVTVGAGITLVIWDNDHSFINAVKKLISFFKTLEETVEVEFTRETFPDDLIREGIELITWFLIHINDIFTGDELIILNPITWQKVDITPHPDFNLTKTWYYSSNNTIDPGDDVALAGTFDLKLKEWNTTALARNDTYMQWLLRPTEYIPLVTATMTQFSFDLFELWIKNFEIHIDLGEIVNIGTGEGGDFSQAFGGCDIEFYLFTHHLAGAFLYNDLNSDRTISVNYTDAEVKFDGVSKNISYPESSELTHRIILNDVANFTFMEPIKNPDGTVSWGLSLENVGISAVPVGIDLDSYLAAPQENLSYAHFGFTFDPIKNVKGADLLGKVKLDQFFAPWNSPDNPDANAQIEGLDMAIIYVSTVLHFHLNVETYGEEVAPEELSTDDDYVEESHELKIGNYLGGTEPLDFVDIAGPYYDYGNETISQRERDNASTAIIPLALWTGEMERHDTFMPLSETNIQPFSSDIQVSANFTVLAYAVCYPEFEDGTGIWHDPTFSVYMVFETKGFWALIVLIAGIGLVGVATILIKRRKDSRF
ncbi:MAG: hypothetical protein ACFFG0_24240 [Candidatus Thorarchaeota archaeon]